MIAVVMVMAMLCGCGGDIANDKAPTQTQAAQKATPTPVPTLDTSLLENKINTEIKFTNGDVIKAELYPDLAPITVANFVKLADEHFYDGLIFHRVIEGFMIQGGGMDANMQQKQTESIKGEFNDNGVVNMLSHKRGVLSMARTSVKDSASSQFFIVQQDSVYLDGQYAAFGAVTEGMDVVDKIAAVQTDANDAPLEPVVIESIAIIR